MRRVIINRIIKLVRKNKAVKYLYHGPLRTIARKIKMLSLPEFVIVGKHKIYIDRCDTLNLDLNRNYGSDLFNNLIAKNVKKGNTVLNIGANIGYYTLILADLVGEKGKVYAFEPFPENFKLLKKNIKVNNYKNVVPINKAVSNKSSNAKLYISEYNQGDHRIYRSEENKKFIEIEKVKLDDFIKEKKIDFLIMDTQGAEYGIFKGMQKIIKRNKKIKIVTEFSPYHLRMFGSSPKEFLKEIKKKRFRIFDIDERKAKIQEKEIKELIKEYDTPHHIFTDLLLMR